MAGLFGYVVVDRGGRKLRGEIEASSETHAADQLRQRGDTVIEVRTAAAGGSMRLESRAGLSDRQLADFAFELRSLIGAGLPLPKALATLASSEGPSRITSLARDLKLQLELGNAASAALEQAKSANVKLFGRFLAAAEQGGRYEIMLGIAVEFLTQRAGAFEKIRSALAYPLFLLTASFVAIGFLVVYVAPSLAPMFEGAEKPMFIAVTAGIGSWIQDNQRAALFAAALFLLVVFLSLRSDRVKSTFGSLIRSAPVVHRIVTDLDFGPALLAYAALLKAGWPAERALRLTAEISRGRANHTFKAISEALRDGATLPAAFRRAPGVPVEVLRAIEIGEQTGAVPEAVRRAGEHLVNRSLKAIDRVSAILGPVMIAAIGGLVALVMISMLSSISSLGDAAI